VATAPVSSRSLPSLPPMVLASRAPEAAPGASANATPIWLTPPPEQEAAAPAPAVSTPAERAPAFTPRLSKPAAFTLTAIPLPPPRPDASAWPSGATPRHFDRWTAVYDLTAHTVTLPDGTKLEAHSGLGDLMDDPRHVDERDRGATPPHLY